MRKLKVLFFASMLLLVACGKPKGQASIFSSNVPSEQTSSVSEQKKYNVEFIYNIDELDNETFIYEENEAIQLPNIVFSDYVRKQFVGWYSGNSKIEDGFVVKRDMTIEARFELTSINDVVSFDNTSLILGETYRLDYEGLPTYDINKYKVVIDDNDPYLTQVDDYSFIVDGKGYGTFSIQSTFGNDFVEYEYYCENNILTAELQKQLITQGIISKGTNNFTKDQLAHITELNLDGVLTGNSKVLNSIKALPNLKTLSLKNNDIESVDFLSGKEKLEYLDLSDNSIVDLNTLRNLKTLKYLNLSNNYIRDITPICTANTFKTLEELNISDNIIDDITKISNFANESKLVSLNISNNPFTNAAPLAPLTSLKSLDISNSHVDFSSIISFSYFNDLEAINLNNIGVDISLIPNNMPNLKELHIGNCTYQGDVVNIAALLNNHPHLEVVDISSNQLSNENFRVLLENNTNYNIKEFIIGYNQITKLPNLNMFSQLNLLDISGSYDLDSISILSNNYNIKSLIANDLPNCADLIETAFTLNNLEYLETMNSFLNIDSSKFQQLKEKVETNNFTFVLFENITFNKNFFLDNEEEFYFYNSTSELKSSLYLTGKGYYIINLHKDMNGKTSLNFDGTINVGSDVSKIYLVGHRNTTLNNIHFNIENRNKGTLYFDLYDVKINNSKAYGSVFGCDEGAEYYLNLTSNGTSNELLTSATNVITAYNLNLDGKAPLIIANTLENNANESVISVANDFSIHAKNVSITATSGTDGTNGTDWNRGWRTGSSDVQSGGNGTSGGNGGDAIEVGNMMYISNKSGKVDVLAGIGGNAGNGGKGDDSHHDGHYTGGNGGNGGVAGNGGNAITTSDLKIKAVKSSVINIIAGNGGIGGNGGAGGAGNPDNNADNGGNAGHAGNGGNGGTAVTANTFSSYYNIDSEVNIIAGNGGRGGTGGKGGYAGTGGFFAVGTGRVGAGGNGGDAGHGGHALSLAQRPSFNISSINLKAGTAGSNGSAGACGDTVGSKSNPANYNPISGESASNGEIIHII